MTHDDHPLLSDGGRQVPNREEDWSMPRCMSVPVIPIAWVVFVIACALVAFFAPSVAASPAQIEPRTFHANQDSDGDGIGDSLDPDDDNDGILDIDENSPAPPASGNGSTPPDADGDGIGDVLDPDDNNNGVTDNQEPVRQPSQPSAPSSPSEGTNGDSVAPGSDNGLIMALPVTGSGPMAGVPTPASGSQMHLFPLTVACCVGIISFHCMALIRRYRAF
jgi:hypothetical protein